MAYRERLLEQHEEGEADTNRYPHSWDTKCLKAEERLHLVGRQALAAGAASRYAFARVPYSQLSLTEVRTSQYQRCRNRLMVCFFLPASYGEPMSVGRRLRGFGSAGKLPLRSSVDAGAHPVFSDRAHVSLGRPSQSPTQAADSPSSDIS